jgi:psp operon transcriptional activator
MEVQEKILRVVEYGTFEPVGSPEQIEVDVRIIAATNADLSAMVKSGRFKQDLLDRLSFEVLFLPSLKERHEDISLLANHFASRMAFELGREEIPVFSDEAMKALESYPWPGNVRELKNVVERAIYRSDSVDIENITFDPFDTRIAENRIDEPPKNSKAIKSQLTDDFLDMSFNDAVKSLSVFLLQRALNTSKHNQKKAARSLGLTYNQFRGLYRKYKAEIE